LDLSLEELIFSSLSLAVRGQAEISGVLDIGETLPSAHGLDNAQVTVNSGVNTFLPLAVNFASVTAYVGVVSL